MRFSIVVSTLNRVRSLAQTLLSLRDLDYPDFEVIVVNGPSTDGTDDLLAAMRDRVTIGRCTVQNLSVSRNIGLSLCRGDAVAFLDDDAVPRPDWLTRLAPHYADARLGGVGGFTLDNSGRVFQARGIVCDRYGDAHRLPDGMTVPGLGPDTWFFPSLLGTNSSFRLAALRDIDGFDENYAYFLDETDVCARLHDRGYRIVYEPDAIVFHQFASSAVRTAARLPKSLAATTRSKAYFCMRHAGSRGGADPSRYLADYAAQLDADHRGLVTDGRISAAHAETLHQEITASIADGRRAAMQRPLTRSIASPASEFMPFPFEFRTGGGLVVLVSQNLPPADTAGIARYTHELAAGLVSRGRRVKIITRGQNGHTIRFDDGVWVHEIDGFDDTLDTAFLSSDGALPPNIARHAARVAREVALIQATEAIAFVSWPIWDLEGVAADERLTVRTVLTLHTTYRLARQHKPEWAARHLFSMSVVDPVVAAERRLLASHPLIIANSAAIIRDIEADYDMVIQDRSAIVPHGLDPAFLEQRRRAAPPNVTRVLFVGRREPRKGFDFGLRVAEQVTRDEKAIQFHFVGASTDDDALDRRARPYRLEGSAASRWSRPIEVADYIADDALWQAYRDADLVIVPSRYESFGLVAVEALSVGTPVLAAASGGLVEIVIDGVCGFLRPADAIEDWTDTILAFHALEAAARNTMRESALARHQARFTRAHMVDAFLRTAEVIE
ncbi:glycosyltransferase [Lichenihabitans psoromatis]|uniref:glycosyltransferase n=1 Tax=Lichenihabitans psoromatis TaxID=2528642 RepID=UPI0010385BC5|nr:glycosyltransferase [Lichenihabitans psoromatis]